MGFPAPNVGGPGTVSVRPTEKIYLCCKRQLGAFMRSANHIYEVNEGRPFLKRRPQQVAITLVMTAFVAIVLLVRPAGLFGRAV